MKIPSLSLLQAAVASGLLLLSPTAQGRVHAAPPAPPAPGTMPAVPATFDQLAVSDPKFGAWRLKQQAAHPGSTAKPFYQTPYERVIAPIAAKLLAKSNATNSTTNSTRDSTGRLAGFDNVENATPGLSVRFPGFGQTPFVHATHSSDVSAVAAAVSLDMNRDGKPDLVTVQYDGTINVLLNTGSTDFTKLKITSSQPFDPQNGRVSYIYANTADLNHDGYPDLVVTDSTNNAAFVYLNAKDGTFAAPVEYDFNFASGATFAARGAGIAIGDVNGDGIPDLVAGGLYAYIDNNGHPNTVVSVITILGQGDGTFAAPLPEQASLFPGYLRTGIGQLSLADMNADGKADLIFPSGGYDADYNSQNFIAVMLGQGNGAFSSFPTNYPTTGAVLPNSDNSIGSYLATDINGDGKLDIIYTIASASVYVALGNGDGTLQPPTAVLANAGDSNSGGALLLNYADVNGDGKLDIIGYFEGFIAVYIGEGGGKFNQRPLVQLVSGNSGNVEPMPMDFNNDGTIDLVQVDITTGEAGIYPQHKGTFTGTQAPAIGSGSAADYRAIAVGDLNSDGVVDILAQNFSSDPFGPFLAAGINDGTGSFRYKTLLSAGTLSDVRFSGAAPFLVDFTGDGKPDLLLKTFSNKLMLSVNLGDLVFKTPVEIPLGVTPTCPLSQIDVGDINNDGHPDIIVAYGGDSSCYPYAVGTPSGFFTLLGDGKGGFKSSFTPYGYSSYIVKLVDLDGDGKLDLAITDADLTNNYYYLYVVPGVGDGTFDVGRAQYVLEQTLVTAVIPGDFDGDGNQDLMVGVLAGFDGNGQPVAGTTGTYAMQGNGDFTFNEVAQYTPGTYPVDGRYGDFNLDGRPDLALAQVTFNYYTDVPAGNLTTLINLGGGAFSKAPQTFTALSSGNASVFVGDFNNDGSPDALVSTQIAYAAVSELFLNSGGGRLTLSASAGLVSRGQPVTLTATFKPTVSSATPTGTLTLYDNGKELVQEAIHARGNSLTFTSLAVGTHHFTINYGGDAHYNEATDSITVQVGGREHICSIDLDATLLGKEEAVAQRYPPSRCPSK